MNVSTFIDEVRKQHGYCEATILRNGEVEFSVPSHTEFLIRWCEENKGVSREELYKMIPRDAAPLNWLVEYTGNISLYKEFCICSKLTHGQLKTLLTLQKEGVISNTFRIHEDFEKSLLEVRDIDVKCIPVKRVYVLKGSKLVSTIYDL